MKVILLKNLKHFARTSIIQGLKYVCNSIETFLVPYRSPYFSLWTLNKKIVWEDCSSMYLSIYFWLNSELDIGLDFISISSKDHAYKRSNNILYSRWIIASTVTVTKEILKLLDDLIRDLVVKCCNRGFGPETIHPTQKFN